MRYTDEELLKIVSEERKRSIGFGEGDSGELVKAREVALAYYKGEMKDVPSLPNRSKAVDSTVADAIETVLPDVIEVFVGGEDVATFVPLGQADEERAQEETDFVQHVVFTENEGFLVLYTAMKDSMLTRTGIIGWGWEEKEKSEAVTQTDADSAALLQAMAEMDGQQLEAEEREDGMISLSSKKLHGKVWIKAYPSEDFTTAPDTVSLKDATYCCVRDRPRVQDLIARGIDADKARDLKTYGSPQGEQVRQERDFADETDSNLNAATGDFRVVEVRDHYIRVGGADGKLVIWRVTTDSEETQLLDKEEVYQIPFAALTPYIVPHRFYGESVADKLTEVQRIKTALLRSHLDTIYFGLNQRMEVGDQAANEFTISDLLRNEPGVPVRSKTGEAVRPITAGGSGVDTLASLEYASTMAESRSGIVRNAQGLNPDTLHDTAKGAMALIGAAQKRVRMIARIFAETGVKDLFLGIHCMLRNGYGGEGKTFAEPEFKRGQAWKKMQPAEFPERCAMTVHVGVGSAGKDHDLIVSTQRLELMERLIQLQGGVQGPFIDQANVHNALSAWERAGGNKTPEQYWTDPKNAPPRPPKPDPEAEKAKAELMLKQQEGQANLQLKAQEGQMKAQLDAEQGERDHQLAMAKLEAEITLEREKAAAKLDLERETTAAELQMKRELLTAELEMKRETAYLNAEVARETGMAKAQASSSVSEVEPGGEPG